MDGSERVDVAVLSAHNHRVKHGATRTETLQRATEW